MKKPTPEEIQKVMLELGLPPALMTDLTAPVPKNTVTRVDGTIKVTLDFPSVKGLDTGHQLEVKFFISKNSLLTVHYEEMEGLDRFKRQFEVAATLRKKQPHLTGAHLFLSLFNNLYESTSSKLDYMESKLAEIESEIFKNNEKQMVFEISTISKKIIAFRHVMSAHEDVFNNLASVFEALFGKTFSSEIRSLEHQYAVLERRVNMQYKIMTALRETNGAMLNTKQNEIMKIFTVMAFTTFPLMLFSSLFGMNTENTPLLGHPADFWIIVGIMLIATIGFFTYFKHKGWM